MNRIWTDAEKLFIRNNCRLLKDAEIAIALTRISGRTVTVDAVRKARVRMGIKKKHGRGVCEVASFLPPKADRVRTPAAAGHPSDPPLAK